MDDKHKHNDFAEDETPWRPSEEDELAEEGLLEGPGEQESADQIDQVPPASAIAKHPEDPAEGSDHGPTGELADEELQEIADSSTLTGESPAEDSPLCQAEPQDPGLCESDEEDSGLGQAIGLSEIESSPIVTATAESRDPEAQETFETDVQPAGDVEVVGSDREDTCEITTSAVIEAVLFAADEPITGQKLVEILGTGDVKEIKAHIKELNEKYEQSHFSFRIESLAGGFQMLTLSRFNPWLKKLLKVRGETKLSSAALETMAIIAYKQPILRVDIEAIRGVAAGEMIRQLSEKGLVKIVGRAEELGRPLLYGTTKKFLNVFGLNSLKDLPTAEELKPPQ